MVLHAVDGTKIQARASTSKSWQKHKLRKALRRLDKSIAAAIKEIESCEAGEGEPSLVLPEKLKSQQALKAKIEAAMKELEAEGRQSLHPGEREARMMKTPSGKQLGYNAQAVVDEKNGVVVAAEVVTNQEDSSLLVSMIEEVDKNLGMTAERTVADAGYGNGTEIKRLEEAGYDALVPPRLPPARDAVKGKYCSSNFIYDTTQDVVVCPEGSELDFAYRKKYPKRGYTCRRFRCRKSRSCSVAHLCSPDKRGREIEIPDHYHAVQRMRAKLRSEENRAALSKRKHTVEPLFGWIKQADGFRRWTGNGRADAATQWAMLCHTQNLRKLFNLWMNQGLRFQPG
jgi:transposase